MDLAVGEENNPPMVIAANPPFCQLMNYSLHELLGCPLSKIIVPDEKIKKQFLPVLYSRTSSLISDIVPLSPLCVPKDGKMIRLSSRIQLFFSENGVMRWTVTVIEGIEEAPASAEAPMTWLPGLPKWWSAYSNMASSGPLPLATLRASLPPNNRVVTSQQPATAATAPTASTTTNGGDAHSKDPTAAGRAGGAQVTGKRKLGDRSYDLGELLSNFAAPIPSPPVGTGDFAWLLKDGVGGGLVYAGSSGGQRGPLDAQQQQPWLPDFGKKAPLSSSSSPGGIEQHRSSAAAPPGGRGGDSGAGGRPRLGGLKPW